MAQTTDRVIIVGGVLFLALTAISCNNSATRGASASTLTPETSVVLAARVSPPPPGPGDGHGDPGLPPDETPGLTTPPHYSVGPVIPNVPPE